MTHKVWQHVLLGLGLTTGVNGLAIAGQQEGISWLNSNLKSSQATLLQSLQEQQTTLKLYNQVLSDLSTQDLANLLADEQSSEALVRVLLLSQLKQQPTAAYLSQLLSYQNTDGGFGHLPEWESNPLDTALVLLALKELNYQGSAIDKGLAYLASQQRDSGAFKVISLDDYYVSAYALNAFTAYLKAYPQYNTIALKTVTYLENNQLLAGHWLDGVDGLFIDALLNEALHMYRAEGNAANQAFKDRVFAAQASDGSWQDDTFTSSIILRSLKTQETKPVNPIDAGLSFSVIDAETKANMAGVTVTTSGDSASNLTAQTAVDGSVSFTGAKAGDYRFTLSKTGFASLSFQVTLRQGERLNLGQISLSRQSNANNVLVQGRITDKASGQAVAGAQVKVESGVTSLTAVTNSEGRYQVSLNQGGDFKITVEAQGYVRINTTAGAQIGSVYDFSPKLITVTNNIATVNGKILDGSNTILTGVKVLKNGIEVAETDSSGNFSLVGTEAGEFILTFSKEGYRSPQINIKVDAGQVLNVGTVQLYAQNPNNPDQEDPNLAKGVFEVRVLNTATNQLISNPKIVAEKLNSSGQVIQTQSFNADQEPNVTLERIELTIGTWRLTASHPSYSNTASTTLTLTANQTQKVDLKLNLQPYELKGKLVDSQTNKVITSATILIKRTDSGATLTSVTTDANGQYSAKNLTVDNIQLVISSPRYLGVTTYFDKEFQAGTVADFGELRLRPISAENTAVDLQVTATDTQNLQTDQQSLQIQGRLKATIKNTGNLDFNKTQTVEVVAFADVNNNRLLDTGEIILGKANLEQNLAIGASADIELELTGKALFRDAPIGVWVDSTSQVAELKEDNNIRLTSDAAEIKPKQGTLEAEVKWTASYGTDSSPTVAPLEDTNGDGKIGLGDIATVISYNNSTYRAFDGKTGSLKFSFGGQGGQEVVAVADLDKDGIPEIIVKNGTYLVVLDNKGKSKKMFNTPYLFDSGWSSNAYHINIADLDNDGDSSPEIIVNNKIFTYERGLVRDNLPSGQTQAIADINSDGYLDIIGLFGVSDRNGNLIYNFKTKNGANLTLKFIAVGDVLGSKEAQIIAIVGSTVFIFDAKTGKEITSFTPPSSQGGSPVIADFDGDGIADIGIARQYSYVAVRGDGSLIWSTPIRDGSGGTGSTVFDFDNDGQLEAVHYDEQFLRVYDAKTGLERIKLSNSTPTAHEYPVVVDADADGHADIVIGSNGNGIRMISGKNKDWANTRNIWNQYSYHVTNINDDLTVPKQEVNSWEAHNTYRANLLLNESSTAAADATTSFIQVSDEAANNQVKFTIRLGNAGGKAIAAGLPVSFYRRTADQVANGQTGIRLATVVSSKTLNAGEYEDLSYSYAGNLVDFGEIVMVANDPGQTTAVKIQEYTDSNNTARLTVSSGGFERLGLSASLDKTSYKASESVKINSNVSNFGSFNSQASISHKVYDSADNLIKSLDNLDLTLSAANSSDASQSRTQEFAVAGLYSGTYRVETTLSKQGAVLAKTNNQFTVQSAAAAQGLTDTRVSTDKMSYAVNGLVTIQQQLQNTSSNDLGNQTTVLTEVINSQGQVIFSQQALYPQLAANALHEKQYQIQLSDATLGQYLVRTTTTIAGQTPYVKETRFNVQSVTQTGQGLIGALSATPQEVPLGRNVLFNLQVKNTSKEVWQNVPVNVRLFKGDELEPFTTLSTQITALNSNEIFQQALSWKTQGKVGDRITAALTFVSGNGQEKALAEASFSLTKIPVEAELPDYKLVNNQVLVYYSCEAGWYKGLIGWALGNYNYSCFSERGQILNQYLHTLKDSTGLNYRVTYNPNEFKKLMRSGLYNNYWVLGAVEKFNLSTNDELRELSFNGESVLFDKGILDWTNYELLSLADIYYRGSLLLSRQDMQPSLPVYDNSKIDTLLPVKDTFLFHTGPRAVASATYDGKNCTGFVKNWIAAIELSVSSSFYLCNPNTKYPAIVTSQYGSGKPLAYSFDLLRSLQVDGNSSAQKQKSWQELLKQSLNYQRVDSSLRISYAPREAVYISAKVKSDLGTTGSLVVQLPAGAQWLGAGTVKDNKVTWNVDLAEGQSKTLSLPIILPNVAGSHVVKVSVYDESNGQGSVVQSKEYRFLVRGINERFTVVEQKVNSWNVGLVQTANWLTVKTLIASAKLKYQLGLDDLAIGLLAQAGGVMSKMTGVDTTATRKEMDELIRAMQIQWYYKQP